MSTRTGRDLGPKLSTPNVKPSIIEYLANGCSSPVISPFDCQYLSSPTPHLQSQARQHNLPTVKGQLWNSALALHPQGQVGFAWGHRHGHWVVLAEWLMERQLKLITKSPRVSKCARKTQILLKQRASRAFNRSMCGLCSSPRTLRSVQGALIRVQSEAGIQVLSWPRCRMGSFERSHTNLTHSATKSTVQYNQYQNPRYSISL